MLNFKKLEERWIAAWEKEKIFQPEIDEKKT